MNYPFDIQNYNNNKNKNNNAVASSVVLATSSSNAGEAKLTRPPLTFGEVMTKAAQSAARGGTAGAVAMGANVACLMWMRTTVSL